MNRAQILKYIKEDNLALFEQVDAEFIQSFQDRNKDTLLHLATQKGARKIIYHLIKNYPELILKKNNLLANFLTDAWFSSNKLIEELFAYVKKQYPEIFQQYLDSTLSAIDDRGHTILMRVVALKDSTQYDIFKLYFMPLLQSKSEDEQKQYYLTQNMQEKNVAHLIAYYGHEHLIELIDLLPSEAYLVPQQYLSYIPLFEACEHGNVAIAKAMIKKEPLSILELSDYDSNALFVAVLSRKLEMVEFLVEETDVDVFKKNSQQKDALIFSLVYGNEEIMEYLFNHYAQHQKISLDINNLSSDTLSQLLFNYSKKNSFILEKLIHYIHHQRTDYVAFCNAQDYSEFMTDPLNQVLRTSSFNNFMAMIHAGFTFIEKHKQYKLAKDYYLTALSSKESKLKLDYVLEHDKNLSLSLQANSVHSVFRKNIKKDKNNDKTVPTISMTNENRINLCYESDIRYHVNTFGWYLVPHVFNHYSLEKAKPILKDIEKRKQISVYDLYLSLLISVNQQKQDKIDYLTKEVCTKFDLNSELKSLYETVSQQNVKNISDHEKLKFIHFVLLASTTLNRTKYISILNITHYTKEFYQKNQFLVDLTTRFLDNYTDEFHYNPRLAISYLDYENYYLPINQLDKSQSLASGELISVLQLNHLNEGMLKAKNEQFIYLFDKFKALFISYAQKFALTNKGQHILNNATIAKEKKNFYYAYETFLSQLFNRLIGEKRFNLLNYIYQASQKNNESFVDTFNFNLTLQNSTFIAYVNQANILSTDIDDLFKQSLFTKDDKKLLAAMMIKTLSLSQNEHQITSYKKYHHIEKLLALTDISALIKARVLNLAEKSNTLSIEENKKGTIGDASFVYSFVPYLKEMAKQEGYKFNFDKFIIKKISYIKNSVLYYLFEENKSFLKDKRNVRASIYQALDSKKTVSYRGKAIKANIKLQTYLFNHFKLEKYSDLIIDKTTLVSKALMEEEYIVADKLFEKIKLAGIDFYQHNQDLSFENNLTNIFDIDEYKRVEKLMSYIEATQQFKAFENPLYMVNNCVNLAKEALVEHVNTTSHFSESNIYNLEVHLHLAMKKAPTSFNEDNSFEYFITLANTIREYINNDAFYHYSIYNPKFFEVIEFLFSKMKREKLVASQKYLNHFGSKKDEVNQYFEKYLMETMVANEPVTAKKKMKI